MCLKFDVAGVHVIMRVACLHTCLYLICRLETRQVVLQAAQYPPQYHYTQTTSELS